MRFLAKYCKTWSLLLFTVFAVTHCEQKRSTDAEIGAKRVSLRALADSLHEERGIVAAIASLEDYKQAKKYFLKKRIPRQAPKKNNNKTKETKKEAPNWTEAKYVQTLYQLIRDTADILNACGIVWWADGGTLLGAKRHKGLIPWDDDLDIQIHPMHIPKLIENREMFAKNGLYLREDKVGFFVSFDPTWASNNPINNAYMEPTPKLDMIAVKFSEEDDQELHYDTGDCSWGKRQTLDGSIWTGAYIAESEIRRLRREIFGNLLIFTPRSPGAYLTALYGDNYMTSFQQFHSHDNIRAGGNKEVDPTAFKNGPAQPFHLTKARVKEEKQERDWVYRYFHKDEN